MLGILSDSHGNLGALARAADLLVSRGVTEAVHCGDIDSPAAVDVLGRLDVHWVFGNCDHDRGGLERAMRARGHVLHGWGGEVTVSRRRIAFTHGHRPHVYTSLHASAPDYLLHGHTHERRDEMVDGVRILNPGALFRARSRTIAILDVEQDDVEWIEIPRDP